MSQFKLYEFSEQYENLMNYLEENPELDEELLKDTLESVTDSAKDKIINVAGLIQKFTDDIDNIKKRQDELTQLKKQKEKSLDWLKSYLISNMNKLDLKKVDSGTRVVSLAKSPPSAVIRNVDALPEQFKKYKTVLNVDAKELPEQWLKQAEATEVKYDYREVLNHLKELDKTGDSSYLKYAELIKDKHNIRIK